MEVQRCETKIKLLEEALSKNIQEAKDKEANTQQLIELLDKYDHKVDELTEEREFKDMQLLKLYEDSGI